MLVPADAAENSKIRSVRDQLAEVYGFRTQGHAYYQFHISMSYQLRELTAQEQSAYHELLRQYVPRIVAAAPIVELGVPEYCTFADMNRFEPQKLLRCV